jgi:small subunit ribosomal protein S6
LPYYECVFIARQDVSAAQVESLTDDFSKVIEDGDGKVPKKESWGLRSLAYKIKHNRKGHYTLLNINAPAAAVQEMERLMRINEDVLRYLTVKVDELEEGPSAIMQSRSGRDDRPGRFSRDERPLRPRDDDDKRPSEAKKDETVENKKDAPAEAKKDAAAEDKKDEAAEAKDEGKSEDTPDKTGDGT